MRLVQLRLVQLRGEGRVGQLLAPKRVVVLAHAGPRDPRSGILVFRSLHAVASKPCTVRDPHNVALLVALHLQEFSVRMLSFISKFDVRAASIIASSGKRNGLHCFT